MLDAITMWRHTKMVVLVALTGAAYVAILLPFKIATVVPGFTEIRPATGIPIVCGMLFGPADGERQRQTATAGNGNGRQSAIGNRQSGKGNDRRQRPGTATATTGNGSGHGTAGGREQTDTP
jgi:hypothetical protein